MSICRPSPPEAPARTIAPSLRAARAVRGSVLACALLLAACMPTRPPASAVEFVIVRHGEKRSDDPRDPSLAPAGLARAQRLADSLADQPLAAVYATAYRRTQQTAAPAAAAHALAVRTYDAKLEAGAFATTLRRRHADGTVLVVGHSNTVAAIAAALCGCQVTPLGEDEYDRRLQVRIDGRGHATRVDTRTP